MKLFLLISRWVRQHTAAFLVAAVSLTCISTVHGQPVKVWSDLDDELDSLYVSYSFDEGLHRTEQSLIQYPLQQNAADSIRASLLEYRGMFLHELGRYAEAEESMMQARDVFASSLGRMNTAVASCLSELGELFEESGRDLDAMRASDEQVKIYEKYYGAEHANTLLARIALAERLITLNDLKRADALLEQMRPVLARSSNSLNVVSSRFDAAFGKLYFAERSYDRAAERYKASLTHTTGIVSYRYAARAHGAAQAALMLEQADEAKSYLDQAYVHLKDVSQGRQAIHIACDVTSALLEEQQGEPAAAETIFKRVVDAERGQFQDHFKYTSEREQLLYLAMLRKQFARLYSFALRTGATQPSIWSTAMEGAQLIQASSLHDLIALHKRVHAMKDSSALAMLDELSTERSRLARLHQDRAKFPKALWSDEDSLGRSIAALERELAKTIQLDQHITNEPIDHLLERMEDSSIFLQVLRFPYYKGEEIHDTSYYVAVAYKKNAATKADVVQWDILGEAKKLEDPALLRQYKKGIEEGISPVVYDLLWQHVGNLLTDTRTVYYSPDGVYSFLSPQVFDRSQRAIAVQFVPSFYDIAARDTLRVVNKLGVFVANPDFGVAKNVKVLKALPYTAKECNTIATLWKDHGGKVQEFQAAQASKENVLAVQSPAVLHIATHGRLLSDRAQSYGASVPDFTADDHPLFNSALYLAGANRSVHGSGMLTAWEAQDMDLYQTNLVALSACETGLGDVVDGEGPMSLSRAFLIAGAKSVLASLWQVPDKESAELMERFYTKYLNGMPKAKALAEAQQEVRTIVKKRYGKDIPLYYAAFILVGVQ